MLARYGLAFPACNASASTIISERSRMLIHHYAILHVVYLHFRSHPWNALDLLSAVDWIEQCYSASWETPSRQ